MLFILTVIYYIHIYILTFTTRGENLLQYLSPSQNNNTNRPPTTADTLLEFNNNYLHVVKKEMIVPLNNISLYILENTFYF